MKLIKQAGLKHQHGNEVLETKTHQNKKPGTNHLFLHLYLFLGRQSICVTEALCQGYRELHMLACATSSTMWLVH
ncbi:hypothetical protein CsSME_00023278 [Camellia sinensis var. sinensis]